MVKGLKGFQKGEYKHSAESILKIKEKHWSRNLLISKQTTEKANKTKLIRYGNKLITRVYLKCKTEFRGLKSRIFNRKFCSHSCSMSFNRSGKSPYNKGKHMWENKEHPRGMLGKKPWNFIDGNSRSRKYQQKEWKEIAKKCYERDNWKCQTCGNVGLLNAHHIIYWSISKNDSLDNLITLCVICHKKLHKDDIKRDSTGKWVVQGVNNVRHDE
jgi:hypothetical protein